MISDKWIKVAVYAESPMVREGLRALMESQPQLEVIGMASSFSSLVKLLNYQQPEVILLDWNSAAEEAFGEQILGDDSKLDMLTVVILVDEENSDWLVEKLRSGVCSVLPNSATVEEIVAAVEAAATGLVVLHPEVVDTLLSRYSTAPLPTSPLQALTPREMEILSMLALGLSNKNIAKQLQISEHTVKFHISSVFTKLNASSRTEAVALGARLGLIML